mmetsp:Transcript_9047/g.9395  ORF Transcript_9047/g.9395 Transcript_9047/m.9395 type:complete len:237 (+) Transcript_9047:13-723(+)
MGCEQDRVKEVDQTTFPIENEIRLWEKDCEFSNKHFLDVVFELNSKIFLEGESMSQEKFDNYFVKNFEKRYTKDFFEDDFMKLDHNHLDTLKVKNMLFLLTLPKKVVTRKNLFFYDKANYMFGYIKDIDNDNKDYIEKDSIGLKNYMNEIVYISISFLPNLWLRTANSAIKNKKDIISSLEDDKDKICEALIEKMFSLAGTDQDKLTLIFLNELFNSVRGFLNSGYIREFALTLIT